MILSAQHNLKKFMPVLTWLCLVALIVYIASLSFFMHVHVLENGEIICHSHFFHHSKTSQTDSSETHSHSKFEMLFYHITTSKLIFLLLFVFTFFKILLNNFFNYNSSVFTFSSRRYDRKASRAPPCFSF